ncbi:hypothetical protein GJ700_30245 [Duganella sp. FT92W]|uniref:Lipoprotein n=1 Tax=Pseudoduganella rivuli TaxID=2666085 RepID=A0A7X2ITZ6_9BURK|nr:hypothetical protein [Pseudoduganella rivuli]MRV76003.1 hypothetical protein [Pseudoduganella rivuli]
MTNLRIVSAVVSVLLLAGCSMARVYEREQYWTETTAARLPTGTPLADAKALFAANGLELKCCVSGPEMTKAFYASERNVGRALIVEYDVVVVVDVSKDDRVEQVRVQRWGVGL